MKKRLLGQFPSDLNQVAELMAICSKLNRALGTAYDPNALLSLPQNHIENMLLVVDWQG